MNLIGFIRNMVEDRVRQTTDRRRKKLLIESAIGPTPWYWRTFSEPEGFRWRFLERKGGSVTVLEPHAGGDPVLALGMYVYAFPTNRGYFGLWSRSGRERPFIDLLIFDVSSLRPLKNFDSLSASRPWEKTHVVHTSEVAEVLRVPDGLEAGHHTGPASKHSDLVNEVLLLGDGPARTRSDLNAPFASIVVWQPATGAIEVLPQEWFTAAKMDVGYQWITRVARDPESGHIVGGGIRISDFELDDTGRRLLRPL